MKRASLRHEAVFADEAFATSYARRHRKLTARFGREYGGRLAARGFREGTILDAGCGAGGTLLELAHHFPSARCVGVDLAEPLLAIARADAAAAGLRDRTEFAAADVHRIPYPDASFDVVVSLHMVHLVADPLAMLGEIERVLVPSGSCFITDLKRSWLGWFEPEIRSALSLGEARELLARSRLRDGRLTAGALWWRYEA